MEKNKDGNYCKKRETEDGTEKHTHNATPSSYNQAAEEDDTPSNQH